MKVTTEKAFEVYVQETMFTRGWIAGSNQIWGNTGDIDKIIKLSKPKKRYGLLYRSFFTGNSGSIFPIGSNGLGIPVAS